mgnify:CR=1 FL=1
MTYKLVLTTSPDLPTAHLLAEGLVEKKLAACVNIIPSIVSIYKWQGEVEQSQESQLIVKTVERNLPDIDSFIKQHHPYDIPELLVLDITDGSENYLNWLNTELSQEKS